MLRRSQTLNKAASELYEWCMRSQLTVHINKTEAMILKANGFIGPLRPIMFGNAVMKYVTNSTCLNIVIDNRLKCLNSYCTFFIFSPFLIFF